MKNFRFLFLLIVLVFSKLSFASCYPVYSKPESYTLSGQTFTSVWTYAYNLTDTDICNAVFLTTYTSTKERFFVVRSDASATGTLTPYNWSYSGLVSVSTNSNNFNTANPACWCDKTASTTQDTCSVSGLTSLQNSVSPNSLTFKKCSPTSPATVLFKVKFTYTFTSGKPSSNFEYCPKDTYTNFINRGDVNPNGDRLFGAGVVAGSLCQRILGNLPTCALNLPFQVNLPVVNPSSSTGVYANSKKAIEIKLINCSNTSGNTAFPKVTFTDSNGPSTTCYLNNIASTNLGGPSNTNNTVITLAFDSDFSNELCLQDYSSKTNNVLKFDPLYNNTSSSILSKTIWAALRTNATNPLAEVGAVRSKVMIKLDYE
jgi:hypothetical protein